MGLPGRYMLSFLPVAGRLIAVAVVLTGALWAVQRLLGLQVDLISIVGAGLFVVGAFLNGGSSGSHLAEKARATAVSEHDLELLKSDTRNRIGAAVSIMFVGVLTFALSFLV